MTVMTATKSVRELQAKAVHTAVRETPRTLRLTKAQLRRVETLAARHRRATRPAAR
jgi:hypothetical protein